jgi:hypothetical protein
VTSPYNGVPAADWLSITEQLVEAHPLKKEEIVEVVQASWAAIFDSSIGPKHFKIGTHIYPKPQIMGFLLHELIPLEFASRYPSLWRAETSAGDKDLVYVPDDKQSVEIKTSSHSSQIFGNRSYAQATQGSSKKGKSGFYIAINFGKFRKTGGRPEIRKVRFGWLDHSDWIGQTASTGQQARLPPDVDRAKLLTLLDGE